MGNEWPHLHSKQIVPGAAVVYVIVKLRVCVSENTEVDNKWMNSVEAMRQQ